MNFSAAQIQKEVLAKRRQWTLWTPLFAAPILLFLIYYFNGALDRPLDSTFWWLCTAWHAYIVGWFLIYGAIPPLGLMSDWIFRGTRPISYWVHVACFSLLALFFASLA